MKKVLKKNHVIMTALVIMIVVAGYLNLTADESTTTISGNPEYVSEEGVTDISAEDMAAEVQVNPEEDMADIEEMAMAESAEETQSQDESLGDINRIGEAVLTSAAAKNFSAAAKLNREQTRAQNQEMLMQLINNQDVTEDVKQNAMDSLLALTAVAEREMAAETLLEAKGYANSVVAINDASVDVVICLNELTEAQKAQIEDIVKRKAEVEVDQIIITTLQQ